MKRIISDQSEKDTVTDGNAKAVRAVCIGIGGIAGVVCYSRSDKWFVHWHDCSVSISYESFHDIITDLTRVGIVFYEI